MYQIIFQREFVAEVAEDSNRYAEQFLQGHKLSSKSPSGAWEPVTEEEMYVVLGLFMLMGITQKLPRDHIS
jgi:hypothetical protein